MQQIEIFVNKPIYEQIKEDYNETLKIIQELKEQKGTYKNGRSD